MHTLAGPAGLQVAGKLASTSFGWRVKSSHRMLGALLKVSQIALRERASFGKSSSRSGHNTHSVLPAILRAPFIRDNPAEASFRAAG